METIIKKAESTEEIIRSAVKPSEDPEVAGVEYHLIEFTYTVKNPKSDKYGQTTKRKGEPYKISNGRVFVWDTNKDSIRGFMLNGISGVKVLDETFEPSSRGFEVEL